MIKIDREECIGCGVCVDVCPVDALSLDDDEKAVVDEGLCTSCGMCISPCPTDAIETKLMTQRVDTSDYSGVWVFGETIDGELSPVVPQLLGKGKELASEFDDPLATAIVGSGCQRSSPSLRKFRCREGLRGRGGGARAVQYPLL